MNLTPPLTIINILADEWLWAALEHRKRLAPKPRAPRSEKKPTQRRRRTKKRGARKVSPEVLSDTATATSTSPLFVRSPSERSDAEMNSPTSTACAPRAPSSPHRGASPPTPPPGTPIELHDDFDDSEIFGFNLREFNAEVNRRRRNGLPFSHTEPEIDIDVRFFLVSMIIYQTNCY
jgi:hypothetical protein